MYSIFYIESQNILQIFCKKKKTYKENYGNVYLFYEIFKEIFPQSLKRKESLNKFTSFYPYFTL